MSKLTGNKQTDFIILMKLADHELGKVCQANKYVRSLCNDDNFWRERVLKYFPISLEDARKMKTIMEFDTWKEYYQFMTTLYVARSEHRIYAKTHPELYPSIMGRRVILGDSGNEDVFENFGLKSVISNLNNKSFMKSVEELENIDYPKWINKNEFNKIIKRTIYTNQYLHVSDTHDDYFGKVVSKVVEMINDKIEQ